MSAVCTPLLRVPEPMAQLRARYPAALERLWNADAIRAFHEEGLDFDRPTLHREHVFDIEEGVRFGISKEESKGEVVIHVSGSVEIGSMIEASLEKLPKENFRRAQAFVTRAEQLLADLTGRSDWKLLGATGNGVFHWNAAPAPIPESER